jgi:hypothetical protein
MPVLEDPRRKPSPCRNPGAETAQAVNRVILPREFSALTQDALALRCVRTPKSAP